MCLQRLDVVIDWDRVYVLLSEVHSSSEGRLAYPLLLMTKVPLLQRQHDASDPEMEDVLDDHVLFRCFVGPGFTEVSLDHSTIIRFLAGLARATFYEANRQFDEFGLVLERGYDRGCDASSGGVAVCVRLSTGRALVWVVASETAWRHTERLV